MNSSKFHICLICCLLAAFPSFARNLRIVQISDPQLGFRENGSMSEGAELLEKTVALVNELHPDVLVVTGDMVDSRSDSLQFRKYMELIAGVDEDIEVWHLPGNHDVGRFSRKNREAYLSKYGYTHFSRRMDGTAIIGIDSNPVKYADEDAVREEYRWLEKALRRTSRCRHKLVFMHHPPFIVSVDEDDSWNNWPGRYRELFLALFKKYRVDALFAGHLHQSAATSWSGIPVYVCTASGKTLGKGISGINLISISPSGVSCREVPLP